MTVVSTPPVDPVTGNFSGTFPLTPGDHTLTITATKAPGCIISATVDITVPPALTINVSAAPTPICPGSQSTLTAQVSGGTGASTVVFTGPGVSSDPIDGPIAEFIVTPTSTSVYTATATDSVGCTAAANTQVVVNPLPTISLSANPAVIAPGQSSTLTATVGSGTPPYSVEFSDGFVSPVSPDTIVTHQVNPTSTTTYSATVTDFLGCISDPPATITITVSTTPPTPPDNLKVVLCGPKCRVSRNCKPRICGKATPGSVISLFANTKLVAKTKANAQGCFCVTPCRALHKGCNSLVAVAQQGSATVRSNALQVLVKRR